MWFHNSFSFNSESFLLELSQLGITSGQENHDGRGKEVIVTFLNIFPCYSSPRHSLSCPCSYREEPGKGKRGKDNTEALFCQHSFYPVLAPFSWDRGRYKLFLSWALLCLSEDLISGDLPPTIPWWRWYFMAGCLTPSSVHFYLLQTTFLGVPYPSKPTFWTGFLASWLTSGFIPQCYISFCPGISNNSHSGRYSSSLSSKWSQTWRPCFT